MAPPTTQIFQPSGMSRRSHRRRHRRLDFIQRRDRLGAHSSPNPSSGKQLAPLSRLPKGCCRSRHIFHRKCVSMTPSLVALSDQQQQRLAFSYALLQTEAMQALRVSSVLASPTYRGSSGPNISSATATACINERFTLIAGLPPLETSTLKETYVGMKKNEYHVPSSVSSPARNLIRRMLQGEPEKRPNIEAICRTSS
ncbi:hypothetical protein HPB49_004869 [Dermacentor silvarum]|uniref:Uncharacterized protein n=1 Tax=Dermacentor silvarum TaxID=543639 RepID=A0ACB8DV47_DERSI|nr:hypothetical protein HPB49_004869 [Dermacentor silvarum]